MNNEPDDGGSENSLQEQENALPLDERIEKLKNRIIKMFCVYTAVIVVLRLCGYGRLVMGLVESYTLRGMNGMTLGGWLFTAMPVVIAIYASKTRLALRWFLCAQYFALFAMLNYLVYLAIFMVNYGWAAAFSIGYAKIGPFIMAGIALYMLALFVNARELGKLEHEKEPPRSAEEGDYLCCIIVFLVFLVSPALKFHISDVFGAVWDFLPFGKVQTIREEDCGTINTHGKAMCFSPEAKLLAIVGAYGVSVMDSQTLKPIFEDHSIAAASLSFSPDCKYLAVAGESIPVGKYFTKEVQSNPKDMGALALYDVENGFRRIEEVSIPPDADPRKKTFAVSVAFRPDGKSLLCLYYNYWDYKQFSREEWAEIEKVLSPGKPDAIIKWPQVCREIEVPTGRIIGGKTFDKKEETSIKTFRFSTDASLLTYIHHFDDKETPGLDRRNISFIDTRTWDESVFYQKDPKYRMAALYPGLVAEQGKLYFDYSHVYSLKREGRIFVISIGESVLGELDMSDFSSRDIIGSNVALPSYRFKRGRKETVFLDCAISPDGRKAALLGSVQESRTQWDRNNFEFFIVIVNLDGEPRPRLRRYELGFSGYATRVINWFTEKQFTIAATKTGSAKVFHINLDGWEE
jgi:WD40 repeat protein